MRLTNSSLSDQSFQIFVIVPYPDLRMNRLWNNRYALISVAMESGIETTKKDTRYKMMLTLEM